MPLQDHFHPPLRRTHPWRGFHSAWAAAIARHLNRGILPPGYYAIPNIDLNGPVEIDVATLQERLTEEGIAAGSALALWTPPEPNLTTTLDFPPLDLVEVQVFYQEDEPRLIAAVELVSPSNKDRPSERQAFVIKCASYLHQGSSLVIVDAVTARRANLHAELWQLLQSNKEPAWTSPTGLYAAAYHAVGSEDQRQLQAWMEVLTLGSTLPRLPLWLGVDFSVPLDLETCYQATCDDLRLPQIG
jgi:hypothetical protein